MRTARIIIPACMAALLSGCTADIPTVSLGIDDTYYINRMQKLDLHPALTGSAYRWTVTRPDGTTETAAETRDFIFIDAEEGRYSLKFEIIDPDTPYEHEFTVNVLHEEIEYSPYIARVYEYNPAPGQFVNKMPEYEEGDTYADMTRK